MTVQFKTDASVTKGGFRAVYQETHGKTLDGINPQKMIIDKLNEVSTCMLVTR